MAKDEPAAAAEAEQPPVPVVVEAPVALPASARVSLVGIFVIMLIASLYLARAVVLPLVLATLLTLTAAPAVRWIARRGVPPAVAAIVLVAALAIVALGGITLLRGPIADMVSQAPQMAATLRERFEVIRKPFVMLSEASKAVSAPPDGTPATVTVAQPSLLDWLLGTLADVSSVIVATLLLTPFLLASIETFKLKLIRLFPQLSDKKRSLRVVADVEQRISRYLVTVTIINSGLGICIGTAMWVLGMPNPLLWGVGATILNFVPYIGSATGIVLAATVSLTIHNDWASALAPPLAYAAINSLEGTVVTPLTVGRRLRLSIVAILLTLGLTTWMWGIIGTLIGVPMLVVIKAFCDEIPALAKLGMFISAESEPLEESTPAANGAVPARNGVAANGALASAPRVDHTL